MKKNLWILLLLMGCGTASTITETEKGVEATYKAESKEQARSVVSSDAKKYCEKQKKRAIFRNTKIDYTGNLTESEYVAIKKMSKVGSVMTHQVGKPDKANQLGDALTEDCGYVATAYFNCK